MGSPSDPLITFRRVPERAGIDRSALEEFAQTLQNRLARGREFHCRITGDAELRSLNCRFRGKDRATDVLSFPGDGSFLGDVAISRHRAEAQARAFGHSVNQEIQLLMLHGLLHLMGMDHEVDSGHMAVVEKAWRAKLGLPGSLIERAGA